MLYNKDTDIITILLNIYEHMQKDYDYLLVIVGGTGDGKSHFALNLLETWYKVILKQKFEKDRINHIHQDYNSWLKKFKTMKEYDMNIFDESSVSLSSTDHMTKISKDLNKLFDVFRCKKFFSVVILPNFFKLNKHFREDRLRGLIWINKRGSYRFYTRKGITFLNAFNENRKLKSMFVSRPLHQCTFPEYKGILLNPYMEKKFKGVDKVLDSILDEKKHKNMSITDMYKDDVKDMKKQGLKVREIAERLDISTRSVQNCMAILKQEDKNE